MLRKEPVVFSQWVAPARSGAVPRTLQPCPSEAAPQTAPRDCGCCRSKADRRPGPRHGGLGWLIGTFATGRHTSTSGSSVAHFSSASTNAALR